MWHQWYVLFMLILLALNVQSNIMYKEYTEETRVVKVNEGKLKGIIRTPSIVHLPPVEVFLGVPYAAPPVGSYRFMPPGSPQPWAGIRLANKFGHVCPQKLPEMSTSKMSPGRYKYLKRLLEYLTDEDEDCLYLNIYAPLQDPRMTRRYPVIVYIHGESFEWNSGNPYDGSVLASYGEVVVVTLNFRLGVLGFLKPGVDDKTVTNFGLLDQIAALKWIKDNIHVFGGDNALVTLMGHGTGAACVNFLLVSPVPQGADGLFRRAILMSGTALADWALTRNPMQSTIQVSHKLNCPYSDDEMTSCLQKKRLSEIMNVNVQLDPFLTPFGPVVDGNVVPNEPAQIMGVYRDLFSRYELMYGITESESYHLLNGVALTQGLIDREANELLKSYMHAKFDRQPDIALVETLRHYKEWHHSTARSKAEEYRDICLDVLSDARVGAPVVQTADYHSAVNAQSYFYVFTHKSIYGDYSDEPRKKSICGEELPYVFGVPLDESASHFMKVYNMSEMMLSEVVMTMWANFAYSGNPNTPKRYRYLFLSRPEWSKFEIDWPEYEPTKQSYVDIGLHPRLGYRYRSKMMQFWNKYLPDFINKTGRNHPIYSGSSDPLDSFAPMGPTAPPQGSDFYENFEKPFVPESPSRTGYAGDIFNDRNSDLSPTETTETVAGESSSVALGVVVIIGVFFLLVNISACAALYYQRDKLRIQQQNILLRTYSNVDAPRNDYENQHEENEDEEAIRTCVPTRKGKKESSEETYEPVKSAKKATESENVQAASANKMWRLSRQCSTSTMDPHTKVREWIAHEIVQRCSPRFIRRTRPPLLKQQSGQVSTDTSFDQVPSTSISPVLVHGDSDDVKYSMKHDLASKKHASFSPLNRGKVQKVSVAVDATPSARTASILRQTPIEISKSLDNIGKVCVSKSSLTFSKKPSLKRSVTTGDEITVSSNTLAIQESPPKDTFRRSSSINFQVYPPPLQFRNDSDEVLKIDHHHSRSDPVTHSSSFLQENLINGNQFSTKPKIVDISFESETKSSENAYNPANSQSRIPRHIHPSKLKNCKVKKDVEVSANLTEDVLKDINVTSRDSTENSFQPYVDPLSNIQRRNFPKVLPDFPQEQGIVLGENESAIKAMAAKRLSLPHPGNLSIGLLPQDSGFHSQPTTPTTVYHKDIQTQTSQGKVPPPPPPRVSSTLGRKPNNNSPITPLVLPELTCKSQNVSAKSQPRLEPKIIIKPTSTAPVMRKTTVNQKIPHVTPTELKEYPLPLSGETTASSQAPKHTNDRRPTQTRAVPASVPQVPVTPQVVSVATTSSTSSSSKKSSDTSTDESSSNTGTVKRVKKGADGKSVPGKSWYSQYQQSFFSKSKEEG